MEYLLALTLVLTPAYIVKFSLLKFPTDLLMVWVLLFWLVFAGWLIIKKQLLQFFTAVKNCNRAILIFTVLFFIAGIISLFARGFDRAKLGQFIVLFLQPISVFFIGQYLIQKWPKSAYYLQLATYFLLAVAGFYAIVQYFTLVGLPSAWWGNSQEPKRALSFFAHPNFYALWCAPLLAFLIPDVFNNLKFKIVNPKLIFWLLGAAGLLLSLSRAGWLGLAVAIAAYLLAAADNKIRRITLAGAVIIVLIIAAVPNLRWRILLPFYGEKSAVSRFSLWQTGWKGVKESPVTGLGLTGFSRQWETLNTDPGLAAATHNFPHNIFLDFWVETGLIGLIGFVGLISLYIHRGLKNRQNILALGVSLFLIAIIFSGLVDNPYLKNDLAMVFWIILSLPAYADSYQKI